MIVNSQGVPAHAAGGHGAEKGRRGSFAGLALGVLLALLIVLVTPYQTAGADNSEHDEQSESGETLNRDAGLATINETVPNFGGYWVEHEAESRVSSGTLNIWVTESGSPGEGDLAALSTQLEPFIGIDDYESYEIITHPAAYRWDELVALSSDTLQLFETRDDIVFIDIDERRNRLVVGQNREAREESPIERSLLNLGLEADAIIVEDAEPVVLELRQRHRPVVGGLQIRYLRDGSSFVCSVGYPSTLGSSTGFVTNSHCSAVRGQAGGDYWQPSSGSNNLVGSEIVDPPYLTQDSEPWCPANARCRWSDSNFVSTGSSDVARGQIANPFIYPPLNTDWDGATTWSIQRMAWYPELNDSVQKVGRTTGLTEGTVQNTCAHVGVSGSDIVMLCQDRASYLSQGGDSGGPVIRPTAAPMQADAVGIHWGSNGWFSWIGQVQPELSPWGSLNVCTSGVSCNYAN